MKYRKLLLGKWKITHSYEYIGGEWIFFSHESIPCTYTFKERFFVVQGDGFYEENLEIPYRFHSERNLLQTPENIAFINILTEDDLEIEESLWVLDYEIERLRVVFRKVVV